MDYKVIWSEAAIADLHHICTYISQDNRVAAENVGGGILDHVRILESFPFIGPAFPRRSHGAVREIVYGNYRIFYEVRNDPKQVNILRVWHGARGEPDVPHV